MRFGMETLPSPSDSIVQPMPSSIVCDELHLHYATYLRDERDQFPKMLSILVRVDLEDLANAVVVIPLLEKLFFVGRWVTFNEVLQLREIRRKKNAATHDEDMRG